MEHACHRAEEFGKLSAEVGNLKKNVQVLNKAVMEGNGELALIVTVPKLAQTINEGLIPAVKDLKTGVNAFVKYQEGREGFHAGEKNVQRHTRWLIGIMATVILGLLVTLFSMISTIRTELITVQKTEQTE